MSKESKIIKEFSKENLRDERKEVAKKIREHRSKYFSSVKEKSDKEEELNNLEENILQDENKLDELLNQIEELGRQIDYFSGSFLKKILNHQKIKRLQADLSIGNQSFEDLKSKLEESKKDVKNRKFALNEIYPLVNLRDAKIVSEGFHIRELEKWKNFEYNFETLEKYFNEDNLKKLSIEDYIILLQRFPSNILTHVTRQEYRKCEC